MDWVINCVYLFNSIIWVFDNRKNKMEDNVKYFLFNIKNKFDRVVIIGGGFNVIEYKEVIKFFIEIYINIVIIFVIVWYVWEYFDVNVFYFYCFVGNEGYRLIYNINF